MAILKKKYMWSNLQDIIIKEHENKILKLNKALYGLKQAPSARNSRIDKYFQENRFIKSPS